MTLIKFIVAPQLRNKAADDEAITIFFPISFLEHLFHTHTLTGSLVIWLNPGKHRMRIES